MPNLKDLKTRIASVKSTRKITKAMQMVAAAKLRRAQDAAEASRPYTERFNAVLGGLAASVGDSETAPAAAGGHRLRPDPSARRDDGRARPLRRLQRQHLEARQAARPTSSAPRARRSRS